MRPAAGVHGTSGATAELAVDGLARSGSAGLARYGGAPLAALIARARTAQGRPDEALDAIRHALVIDPAANGRARLLVERGRIAVLQGDLVAAREALETLAGYGPDPEAGLDPALALLALEVAALDPEASGTIPALVGSAAKVVVGSVGPLRERWELLAVLARVAADYRLPDVVPDLSPAAGPVIAALAEQADAERCRVAGPDPARWRALADTWERLGDVPKQVYARYRAAAASRGDRAALSPELARAAELAALVGAEPLLGLVNQLARRARVRLDTDVGRPHAEAATLPFRLTERELEVLCLVADGRTNGEIAQTLFIATKTASVHVSNIIAKLGVGNRGEAAAVAHRLQICAP